MVFVSREQLHECYVGSNITTTMNDQNDKLSQICEHKITSQVILSWSEG